MDAKRVPAGLFLLRKSRRGEKVAVLNDRDFPLRFSTEDGRRYVVELTRARKCILKALD